MGTGWYGMNRSSRWTKIMQKAFDMDICTVDLFVLCTLLRSCIASLCRYLKVQGLYKIVSIASIVYALSHHHYDLWRYPRILNKCTNPIFSTRKPISSGSTQTTNMRKQLQQNSPPPPPHLYFYKFIKVPSQSDSHTHDQENATSLVLLLYLANTPNTNHSSY